MKRSFHLTLGLIFIVELSALGCNSTAPTSSNDRFSETSTESFTQCENYPMFETVMGYGAIAPPIGWSQAYLSNGDQAHFSLENFFCDDAYADRTTLILVIGAGWCNACSRLIETGINPIATNLVSNLGAELVYLEIQDRQYQAANSLFSYRHLQNLIGDGEGWRVGDLDTLIREGKDMIPAPRFIAQQPNLPTLPAVWVIRKRDMRIIATRELAWQARPGELPLELIAMDPEQDWGDPPLPPFVDQCEPGDEEETNVIRNDVIENATVIDLGMHRGGICDEEPDFYTWSLEGAWTVTLEHDTRRGDLDLILWDETTNVAAIGDDGRIIGSLTAENIETLSGEGPAHIQIRGYGGSSASYTLTLQVP